MGLCILLPAAYSVSIAERFLEGDPISAGKADLKARPEIESHQPRRVVI